MHEMALAEGILAVVLDAADGKKVRRICLRVGRLQMVVPASLEFSFQLVAEGTPAAQAVLELEQVPARLRCKLCGAESEFNHPPFLCAPCGAVDLEVVSGDELLVEAVELDDGVTIRRRAVPADELLHEHLREHHAHDDER